MVKQDGHERACAMPRERGENGQYVGTITDEMVLGVFDEVPRGVLTTHDVAEALGCTQQTVRMRLQVLRAAEAVDSRQSGSVKLFWRTEPRATPSSGLKPHPEAGVSASAGAGESESAGEVSGGAGEPTVFPSAVVDAIAEVDVPGGGEKERARREALGAVIEHLAREGVGTRSEFQAEVYPEHSGGYASAQSWWKNCIGPALAEVRDDTESVTVDGPAGNWQWVE